MSLYQEWQDLIENQTEESFQDFWKEYSDAEIKIYNELLNVPGEKVVDTFQELADKYQVSPTLFMGFLDGINASLKKENKLEAMKETSEIELDVDLEKLYYNMLAAKADHLYTLPQWEMVLSEEKRGEIMKQYKQSRTVVKGEKIGRNDPCPCGSGKKYKKCCGK